MQAGNYWDKMAESSQLCFWPRSQHILYTRLWGLKVSGGQKDMRKLLALWGNDIRNWEILFCSPWPLLEKLDLQKLFFDRKL